MEQCLNFFSFQRNNSNLPTRQIAQHWFHNHSSLRMYEDATAMMETPKTLLWCSTVLITLKVINIMQIAPMGASRRG
jgi:hypothetical protein